MKTEGHINLKLDTRVTGKDLQKVKTFLKIIEDAMKMIDATNILYRIATKDGGTREFAEKNKIDETLLPYLFLSQFGKSIAQSHEMFLNTLKMTLTTDNLKNRKGEPCKESIGEISPIKLLDMLKKHTSTAEKIKQIIESNKELRNAISHGLIWYENKKIYWADSTEINQICNVTFKEFAKKRGRTASLSAECLRWTVKNLVGENFFS
jgi:hypothetical protein